MGSHGNSNLDRGIALKVEGRYDEAITEFRELLSQDPNSSDGHHQLGLVFGFIGLFDELIEELQKAVMLAPTRVEARVDLALTCSMLGEYEKADRSLRKCCGATRPTSGRSTACNSSPIPSNPSEILAYAAHNPSADTPSAIPSLPSFRIGAGARNAAGLVCAPVLSAACRPVSVALHIHRASVSARQSARPCRALDFGHQARPTPALEPAALGRHRAVLPLAAFRRRDASAAACVPLWNPYQFCGTPFVANSQSAVFYPGNLLFYRPAHRPRLRRQRSAAPHALRLVHLSAAAASGLPRTGALLGGVVYAFSAWQVNWLQLPTFLATSCWFPLLLRQIYGSGFREMQPTTANGYASQKS